MIKQGRIYSVPYSTYNVYLRRVSYRGSNYCKATLEFISKTRGGGWKIYNLMRNVKSEYKRISHWEKV